MNRNARVDDRNRIPSPITNLTKITALIFSLSLALGLGAISYAQSNAQENAQGNSGPQVVDTGNDLKNFGKVNEHLYRGAKPEGEGYRKLAVLGIKTIIDLRDNADLHSRRLAEGAGLQYFNIGLNAKRQPTEAESDRFLQLVNDQKNWPVYVHCAAGRHRTGAMIAVYRMEVDGWDSRQAYEEMKEYKFYSRFGHGELKDYVFEYYEKMKARRAALLIPDLKAKQGSAGAQDR